MTEPLNGLRFDIYERVHLPDDVAAIEELEEIELVPHMQVVPQQDSVLLSGHLLLSGVYRGEQAEDPQQLEHWIPVEITLPLNRVQSVEDIAVEIDNFDIDLLSTRALNVTGVLALRGLQASASPSPIWKDDSFTVVHQAQPGYEADFARDDLAELDLSDEPAAPAFAQPSAPAYPEGEFAFEPERVEPLPQPQFPGLQGDGELDNWLAKFQQNEASRRQEEQSRAESQARAAEAAPAVPASNPPAEQRWGDLSSRQPQAQAEPQPPSQPAASPFASVASRNAEDEEPVAQEAAPEPPKLAVNVQALDPSVRIQSGVGLLSQLGDIGAKRENEQKQLEASLAEEKAASAKSAASTGDEIEWTRLFLSGAGEAQSFRKVRMCIVQREDTLESIAGRYNVQPRALQLHNRLNDPYLSEGQVLYIP